MERQGCQLCPRMCGAQRGQGELGFCGMPARLHAARAALHFWEEPPISGESGSGAVFFSGCSLGCAFCQNSKISQERFGKEITTRRLREIFKELIEQGARNINLVTPTHFLPEILPALEPKLPVPVVYNCGARAGRDPSAAGREDSDLSAGPQICGAGACAAAVRRTGLFPGGL